MLLERGSFRWYAPGERQFPLTHAISTRVLPTGTVHVSWMIRSSASRDSGMPEGAPVPLDPRDAAHLVAATALERCLANAGK